MSALEVVEQFRKLPAVEQREAFEKIREVVHDFDDELTPEQIAELDRRAEDALKNPRRGVPWEQLRDETLLKYRK
jgi:putative addiction module component (TIGR02574 family)